jgi:hypothetical protein
MPRGFQQQHFDSLFRLVRPGARARSHSGERARASRYNQLRAAKLWPIPVKPLITEPGRSKTGAGLTWTPSAGSAMGLGA